MQVYLDFGVLYEGFDTENQPEMERKELNDTLEAIEVMEVSFTISLKSVTQSRQTQEQALGLTGSWESLGTTYCTREPMPKWERWAWA